MYSNPSLGHLSLIFKALGHPIRLEILSKLRMKNATVKELAQPFEISLPAMTKHLKVLEEVGLIDKSREAQWRVSALDTKPLQEVNIWLNDYKIIWEKRMDRLEKYIQEQEEKKHAN